MSAIVDKFRLNVKKTACLECHKHQAVEPPTDNLETVHLLAKYNSIKHCMRGCECR